MSTTEIREHDEDAIRNLLMGRKVTKVSEDSLILDDGRVLVIEGNEGCGGCSSGWYELTELNECPDNAIMNVEFEWDEDDDKWEPNQSYRVFVLAADRRIKVWQVDGNDGNGYYGTGYWIKVSEPVDA